MVTAAEIESALGTQLPAGLEVDAHALGLVLAQVANGQITVAEGETRLAEMSSLLEKLSGRKVRGPLISIGGDQAGRDVTIGDVAGGAILKINLQAGGVVINLNTGTPGPPKPPPPRLRVLICHPDDPALEPLVRGLAGRLKDANYVVATDQELLEPGRQWQLFAWLGLAHAVVVFLTPASLQSDRMLSECQILTGRSVLQERVTLIPVLLDAATVADLSLENWAALDMGAAAISGLAGEALQDSILARIPAEAQLSETFLEKVERQIAGLFERASEKALVNAAKELGLDAATGLAGQALRDALAGAIWYADVLKWETTLQELATDSTVPTAQVAEWMLPAWVNPRAARGLLEATRPGARVRAVALNGQQAEFVGEAFIRRAYYLPPDHRRPIVVVNPLLDGRPIAAHVREIHESIKERVLGDRFLSEEDFEPDLLDELKKWPVYVIVPPPIPPQPELDEVLKAFPWPGMTFFLLLKSEDKDAAARLTGVLLLYPLLQEREEHRALRQYNRIRPRAKPPPGG